VTGDIEAIAEGTDRKREKGGGDEGDGGGVAQGNGSEDEGVGEEEEGVAKEKPPLRGASQGEGA